MHTDHDRLSTDDLVDADRADDREMADRAGDREMPESNGEREAPETARPSDNVSESDAPLELFDRTDVERFREEWREIQSRFVDDPRDAVQGADHLVAEVMQSLATTFNNHKHELEGQWQQGSDAQTEDLRQALRRYRTFFHVLISER